MDPLNLQRARQRHAAPRGDRARAEHRRARATPHTATGWCMFATHQLPQRVGPGYGERAAQQLEADVKAGALGLGEIVQGLRTDGRARPTARA